MIRSRLGRVVGTTSVCVALALTAACGASPAPSGSAGSSDPPSVAPSSPTSTAASDTAAVLTKADLGPSITAALRKAGSYTFTLNITAAGQTTTGKGEARIAKTPESHLTMQIQGQPFEEIVTGGYFYMKAAVLHTDKPWLKIDPKAKSGVGALIGQLGGNSDPTKSLDAMASATDVRKVGAEDVNGVATTHYAVTLPKAALIRTGNFPKELTNLLPATFTYQLWIDQDNLVRKIVSAIEVQGQSSDTEIDLDNFGDPVAITAPPASQTTTKSPLGG